MSNLIYDHILVIGFGGPEKPEDVMPFLKIVTQGRGIPEERLKSVAHHYEVVGGKSPYNPLTFRLMDLLRERLLRDGIQLPVFLGMRNWHPFLRDTVREIRSRNLKQGLAVILAPHRSEASCRRYKANVEEALKANNISDIHYDFLEPWFEHPGFISAQAAHVREVLEQMPSPDRESLLVLFSNHSIPIEMNEGCPICSYSEEFKKTSEAVAAELQISSWELGYQSRSGNPRTPWLEPDVSKVIERFSGQKKAVLLIPVGFLCDNVEVLYDLDIEAKAKAESCGMRYYRASTVTHHPNFVGMLSSLIGVRAMGHIAELAAACQSCGVFAGQRPGK